MESMVGNTFFHCVNYFPVVLVQVMLACGKYNLVYEFYNKVKRSYIPSALNYKGLLLFSTRIIMFQRSIT